MGKTKGLLNIDTLTLLALAIIILGAILVLMAVTLRPGQDTLRCQGDWQSQCNRFLTAGGCLADSTIKPIEGGYISEDVAECAVGTDNEELVKAACCRSGGTE